MTIRKGWPTFDIWQKKRAFIRHMKKTAEYFVTLRQSAKNARESMDRFRKAYEEAIGE